MITLAFKLLVEFMISPLVRLDDVSFSTSTIQAFESTSGFFSSFYSLLPLTILAVLSFFGLILVIEGFVGFYKGIMWVIKKIPFIG